MNRIVLAYRKTYSTFEECLNMKRSLVAAFWQLLVCPLPLWL